jgi:hypothetical protein
MKSITVPKDKIAERAFDIFKSRGGKPGMEIDDWLQAEKELTQSDMSDSILQFKSRKKQNSNSSLKYAW